MRDYPREPPKVYVKPTPEMVIKPQHVYVDACGYVQTPYLISWDPAQSSLLFMAQEVSICFGEDPPLFAKTNSIPSPNQSATATDISRHFPETTNYSYNSGFRPNTSVSMHNSQNSNRMMSTPQHHYDSRHLIFDIF